MKKLGLDLRALDPSFKSHWGRGIGRYTREITSRVLDLHLKAQSTSSSTKAHELEIIGLGKEQLEHKDWQKSFLNKVPLGKITLETQLFFPQVLKKQKLDLVHFFAHGDAPYNYHGDFIVTVLDLIPLKFPELYKADKPSWRYKLARCLELEAIKKAKHIVTISQASKKDIVEILKYPEEKITVTPLAVSEDFNIESALAIDSQTIKTKFGMAEGEDYLLYVGGIDPRKNVPFLLELFALLLERNQILRNSLKLLLVGRYEKEDKFPELKQKIKDLGLENQVILTGFIEDKYLPSLYHHAQVFVFPSLYEGFGFPLLEAMSCGVPVMAGDNSSVYEVVGDAGIILRDSDLEIWVRGLEEVLTNQTLRANLVTFGLQQTKKFSWDATAQITYDLYQSLI